ncbi:uncharacterized protein LOC110452781 [Mizuhopecten yessoensis]|uniref:uncharacterized protein LOC110452781 n=1 Tax=Mizuhopecten yessoensis TaxID=6573 RepID=UPI000B4588DE|nr:uncharacterized protein LOC110452781 [Mizuhopecten yessoensis]
MASSRSVRRAQEPVTYTCALCASEDRVRWYCNDCQDNVCDRCKEAHSRGKKTKHDEVVLIGEANRQGDKPVPEVCKLHPGKLCDVYCCDCDILMCLMCFSQTHKQHNWKHFEDEFQIKKQHLQEHMTAISARIAHFKNKTSKHGNKTFKVNIDTMRKDVNTQRAMIKSEIDSIADAVLAELSSLEKEEAVLHQKDCQKLEKNVRELTSLFEKAEMTDTTSTFEMERSLTTTLPLYDVNVKDVLPKLPSFVTGSIDRVLLTKMLGELHHGNQYEKTEIDSKHVQRLSKFTVTQQNRIICTCPVDDSHAWLSIYHHQGLVLVNREGMVIETVKLDFRPYMIAMVGTTDILMTSHNHSTFVNKLSLHNKQVTTFADIRPHNACDISINERDEVVVSTTTPDMVVLNQAGTIVRKVTCGMVGRFITCLSSGDIAVSDAVNVLIITDRSGTNKYKWSGELNNGQKVGSRTPYKLSCDKYDRLFVPDVTKNQVYVLPRDSTQATCLLDQKHGVISPTAVGVDTCGNVWIGCWNGTVHVMRLWS